MDAATRIVPMLPTTWARTTGDDEEDGAGVALADAEGDVVAPVPAG